MTTLTRIITTGEDLHELQRLLDAREKPFTVAIKAGKHRTNNQNRLQRMWVKEAEEQLQEYTAEDYRAYCKLHFGVPILRLENEAFCEIYDRLIRPRTYEEKLEMMRVPIDLPVTSQMTTKQKKAYLDAVHKHFTSLGVQLTEPKDKAA